MQSTKYKTIIQIKRGTQEYEGETEEKARRNSIESRKSTTGTQSLTIKRII